MTTTTPRSFDHYTHVALLKNELGVRVRDPISRIGTFYKVPFTPKTYTLSDRPSPWRTIDGDPVTEKVHQTIRHYQDYTNASEKIGRDVFGVISPVYQFMAESVSKKCGVPFESLRAVYIDIEVESTGGFAAPENPTSPITAITIEVWGKFLVWGYGDYSPTNADVTYVKCDDEHDLLHKFLTWWASDYPDILTGWNVQFYDVPYIVNRITRLRETEGFKHTASALSPWRRITTRNVILMGKTQVVTDIVGVNILDYLELYRKYSLTQRESYRLDSIALVELGKGKVSYDEYGSLDDLATNDYQKFIDYNVNDTRLVRELNDKLHHLDLCTQLAYSSRVNYADTFKQVRVWDALMYYELQSRMIAVPPRRPSEKVDFIGAFVKDPHVGKHGWTVSFDVNSLYPSIMRQWNISADRHLPLQKLIDRHNALVDQYPGCSVRTRSLDYSPREWLTTCSYNDAPYVVAALQALINMLDDSNTTIDNMLNDFTTQSDPWPFLRILSVAITPNRQVFRTDTPGFLPDILADMYEGRKAAKKKEITAKKKAETAPTQTERDEYAREGVKYSLIQNTMKIALNSCYGGLGSAYHRFFDVRQAEAVTTTGQLIIRAVAFAVNNLLNKEFGTTDRDYCLAMDTDSVYLTLDPIAVNLTTDAAIAAIDTFCETVIQPVINKTFADLHRAFNTLAPVLGMKREVIAEHSLWTAKKRYLLWVHDNEGVRHTPPKLKVTGIEAVRSSTPKYGREVIKKALEYFITGDKDAFYTLLDTAEAEFNKRPFEDIASPRTVNGLGEYALEENGAFAFKTPIHVKGALMYNAYLERTGLNSKYPMIRSGEKIRFCYLKPQNPLRVNVIAAPNKLPSEWKMEQYLDRYEQFEKTVLNSLENVINYAGWSIRPITTLF